MKKLLSYSIIAVLAMAFSFGCKQDSVSTGGPNSIAPVQKNQQPLATSIAKATEKSEDEEDDNGDSSKGAVHYKAHLIDVLNPYPLNNPNLEGCISASTVFNGDLDVTVNPSGKWHMTVSNFNAMDWSTLQGYWYLVSGYGGNGTPNDAFNAAIADTKTPNGFSYESQGILFIGSGSWLEKGGHYKGSQKKPVTILLTDYWNSGSYHTIAVSFSRSASGAFTCSASCQ